MNKNGLILWRGASPIDNGPIIVIAIGLSSGSTNAKTGNMLQTYILRDDMSPIEALKTSADASICGDCPLRGDGNGKNRGCYVNLGHGPGAVYRSYAAGRYGTATDLQEVGRGRFVRLGTYGDPAIVPVAVWRALLSDSIGHTGYTHQWRTAPELRDLCMASADTATDAREAWATGWRTFRVASNPAEKTERLCPASAEAGRKLTCIECGACDGANGKRGSIYIPAHGAGRKNVKIAVETA